MQLCALDAKQQIVFAPNAHKQHDYLCIECNQTVRVRSGSHRQPHFYHLRPNIKCNLHSKGMPHLMLQQRLIGSLPKGEAAMECRFPTINRIADVVWHTQHLIFEIQCSPISPQEALARNRDYATIGYRVIWILHADRYNQFRLSPVEQALYPLPHYFTDIDAKGEGEVFDQLSIVQRGMRMKRTPRTSVDLTTPLAIDQEQIAQLPEILKKRSVASQLYFKGDAADRYLEQDPDFIELEATLKQEGDALLTQYCAEQLRRLYAKWMSRPYNILFRYFLEKACR